MQFDGWVPALVFGAVAWASPCWPSCSAASVIWRLPGTSLPSPSSSRCFLYALSLGCGIVLGWVFSEYLFYNGRNRFLTMLICMLLGTALGYWAGQMLLQKSLRVLSKGQLGPLRRGAAGGGSGHALLPL